MSDAERVCPKCALTFEMLIADPLTRAVMDSDGVTTHELVCLLETVSRLRLERGIPNRLGSAA